MDLQNSPQTLLTLAGRSETETFCWSFEGFSLFWPD
jgi:hypothetical protein